MGDQYINLHVSKYIRKHIWKPNPSQGRHIGYGDVVPSGWHLFFILPISKSVIAVHAFISTTCLHPLLPAKLIAAFSDTEIFTISKFLSSQFLKNIRVSQLPIYTLFSSLPSGNEHPFMPLLGWTDSFLPSNQTKSIFNAHWSSYLNKAIDIRDSQMETQDSWGQFQSSESDTMSSPSASATFTKHI